MSRRYDSSRRCEAATRTRDQILASAFQLHGEGNIDIEALARAANVSVATVRKHFRTREVLFENCTAYGMHLVPMPDLAALDQAEAPEDRTEQAVREVYALHESLLGQTWLSFKYEHESPALAATLQEIEELIAQVASHVLAAWPPAVPDGEGRRGLLVAMLSPLTYRALRVHGGLLPEQAVAQTTALLVPALAAGTSKEEVPIADTS